MDLVNALLPHCIWALAAVVAVFRVVGRRTDVAKLKEIEQGLDNQQTSLGQLKLVDIAVANEIEQIKGRLDHTRRQIDALNRPVNQKVVF